MFGASKKLGIFGCTSGMCWSRKHANRFIFVKLPLIGQQSRAPMLDVSRVPVFETEVRFFVCVAHLVWWAWQRHSGRNTGAVKVHSWNQPRIHAGSGESLWCGHVFGGGGSFSPAPKISSLLHCDPLTACDTALHWIIDTQKYSRSWFYQFYKCCIAHIARSSETKFQPIKWSGLVLPISLVSCLGPLCMDDFW